MSDVAEIRSVLAGIVEQLGSAYQHAGLARARIADAVAVLDGLGEQHSEPLVPPELRQAAEELERGLGLISGGASAVADIDARL
jgi:cytolysin (calcineurin-like family phosphatase)